MKKRTKICLIALAAVIAVLGAAIGLYANNYARAVNTEAYLTDDGTVIVTAVRDGWLFDGPGTDDALIFYPGGKVEETAYAPLLHRLAAQGVDCFLVKMPLKLAFTGINKADHILAAYDYSRYYLAGHSLGGAMAANYMADHLDEYDGLFLLAAYPTKDLTAAPFPVVFIVGDQDGVVNREKLAAGKALSPPDSVEVVIAGGNHAGFGSYGEQKGDGVATISAAAQQQITADAILEVIEQ